MLVFFSKLLLKIGDIISNSNINNKLNNKVRGIKGKTIFLLFILFSLTNFDIAVGSPIEQRVIKRLNVGNIREYVPIPSVFIALVKLIFIIIPNILVMKPPIIKIIVDFINLFFIIKIYDCVC